MFYHYFKDQEKCKNCNFCTKIVKCPSSSDCIGCKACYLGCPFEAINKKEYKEWKLIGIHINDKLFHVPEKISIKSALEYAGFKIARFPEEDDVFAPCETGGCYSCSVFVSDKVVPSCHTPVKPNMKISLKLPVDYMPKRIIRGFTPHSVGGVGTPYSLKRHVGYIEVACFSAGCNFRCRTCQNYDITYNSSISSMTPEDAASQLSIIRWRYGVKRMAISGGEATLNRPWLIQFFKHLKQLNPDKDARLHLDTNASILTEDYIDELIEVGVTDIGPDLKSFELDTFIKVTCVRDKNLAQKYLSTAWNAVKYIANNYYPEKVFMGVGLPYNNFFYENTEKMKNELLNWGENLANIDPNIQVCILDYRPEFRSRLIHNFNIPTYEEMKGIKRLLEQTGLKCVTAQTRMGYLGPND
ncbi:MAG: radical SAM protein [Candidatus Helarchaeota archaeon]|nr:radical SAM protein [Candidatus Helarchaeota archaeon]